MSDAPEKQKDKAEYKQEVPKEKKVKSPVISSRLSPAKAAELAEYKAAIEGLAKSKSEFLFPNSGHRHAAIVLSCIVKYSNDIVRIYDDGLEGDISGIYDPYKEFLPLLEFHIHSKKRLEIVVRDASEKDSAIYKTLESLSYLFADTLKVCVASPAFQESVKEALGADINFAVGDSAAFRIEQYVHRSKKRRAVCSFNKPDYAKVLNDIFDSQLASCEPVFCTPVI